MLIKNRTPSLRERGKIKIGMKGASRPSKDGGGHYQLPVKLDHFIVTTMEMGEDGNFVPDTALMQAIASKTDQDAGSLTRIPVRLLFNDLELNFASRYACYDGKSLFCSGDGEEARRRQPDGSFAPVSCTCERIERDYVGKDKCKINGNLAVIIDGAPGVGGVWRFRTTSFNSTDALLASLVFIQGVTGGQLALVPLELVVTPKKVADPSGKQQTIYMVGLEFPGSVEKLRETALHIASRGAQARLQIEHVEKEARRMLEPGDGKIFESDDPDDVQEEFYPDEDAPPVIEPPKRGRSRKEPKVTAPDGPEQNAAVIDPPQMSSGAMSSDAASEPNDKDPF